MNYNGKWMEVSVFPFFHRSSSAAARSNTRCWRMLDDLFVFHFSHEQNDHGWALGIGLERLAMSMFHIPDIRLFWLTDKRFLSQFESVKEGIRPGVAPPVFQELSKFPACYKDVSFFLPKGMKRERRKRR